MSNPTSSPAPTEQHTARRFAPWAVAALLLIQAGLLAYSATTHSPTHLEPAFLASGLSHWKFGRFELYRVNPPLPRMIAAIPLLFVDHKTDWSDFYEGPGSRSEFSIGNNFIRANGPASIPLFFYARWACIPFSTLGAYFAFRWARDLYGLAGGFVTLILFVFEPNLLAHGELVTPDAACTAFGIMAGYVFWHWLKEPTWLAAILAGGALGLAELSKLSWLILFGLWPALWLFWRWTQGREERKTPAPAAESAESMPEALISSNNSTAPVPITSPPLARKPGLAQLAVILVLALYLINLGYVFDGFGTPLKDFQFVSKALTGLDKESSPGNRFRETWLGSLPVPLPKQYVLGFDSQKKDLEHFPQKSYLRGEWKDGGWWYYYLYGLLVKVPCGTWGLLAIIVVCKFLRSGIRVPFRDETILLAPAILLIIVASSQTSFSIHLRYVFPALSLTMSIYLELAGHRLLQMTSSNSTSIC